MHGRIGITQLADELEARTVAEGIVSWMNEVDTKRNDIDPTSYQRWIRVSILDILKCLPRKNCGDCGLDTCMAFAVELLEERSRMSDCTLLALIEYRAVSTD